MWIMNTSKNEVELCLVIQNQTIVFLGEETFILMFPKVQKTVAWFSIKIHSSLQENLQRGRKPKHCLCFNVIICEFMSNSMSDIPIQGLIYFKSSPIDENFPLQCEKLGMYVTVLYNVLKQLYGITIYGITIYGSLSRCV